MINPDLKYGEALAEVLSGEKPRQEQWRFKPGNIYSKARDKLRVLISRSLAQEDGLFSHGITQPAEIGVSQRALRKGEAPSYAQADIRLDGGKLRGARGHQRHMRIADLGILAQLPLEIDLLAIHELGGAWNGSFYHVPMNEMFFNVSDHSKKPFSVGLAWSSTGFVYSTHQQAPHFDLHAEYQRKMALPPDKDPLGREIPRPCYWYDVGNGQGFIRGNGMNNFALDSRIAINSQFLPDRNETVVFAFGKPPYGPIQDKEMFIR